MHIECGLTDFHANTRIVNGIEAIVRGKHFNFELRSYLFVFISRIVGHHMFSLNSTSKQSLHLMMVIHMLYQ